MADTRWFHRDFITAAVSSSLDNSNSQPSPYPVYRLGSAALQGAQGFQIPGKLAAASCGMIYSVCCHCTIDLLSSSGSIIQFSLSDSLRIPPNSCLSIQGMYSLAHRLILGWMAGIRGGPAAGPSNPSASGANSNEWLGDQIPQVCYSVDPQISSPKVHILRSGIFCENAP